MTSLACAIVSPISSVLDANTHFLTLNETKRRSSSIKLDETMIRLEDKKRRFSMKDRERLEKWYRQIHGHSHCNKMRKGTLSAFPLNAARWRRERERSKSVCSGLIRERVEEKRTKENARSQSAFTQCSITLDEETEFVNNDMPSYSGTMLSQMLEEADKRKKLRRGERNHKRAKMLLTCGAMTLLVILVTLVMASYPSIQRVFGG
jgi:hypothetical protein